jgi:hypothetical protein
MAQETTVPDTFFDDEYGWFGGRDASAADVARQQIEKAFQSPAGRDH